MPRVVVLGSINVDLTVALPKLPLPGETVLGADLRKGPGGKGANQAVAAARAGGDVLLLAAVGEDDFGSETLDGLRLERVDVSEVMIVPGLATGAALIFVADGGENMIGVASGANWRVTPEFIEGLPDTIFTRGSILLAGLESPIAAVDRALRRASAAGLITILNPAPADRAILRGGLLEHVHVLTPNRGEAEALSGCAIDGPVAALRAAETLREAGARAVVVTLGAEGYVAATPEGPVWGEAFAVVPVDTVGAGDAFNGNLAASLAEGLSLKKALRRACAAGALAVTKAGAQGSLPTRSGVDALLLGRAAGIEL